jgi:hypothetical protein
MKNVESTIVQSIGYNQLSEELNVILKSSPETVYNFQGVKRDTANEFFESSSKGQYFNKQIKGRFPTTKQVV